MNGPFEIYFSELDDETQKALLEYFDIEGPEEYNWDVIPIALVYAEENNGGLL